MHCNALLCNVPRHGNNAKNKKQRISIKQDIYLQLTDGNILVEAFLYLLLASAHEILAVRHGQVRHHRVLQHSAPRNQELKIKI
jgi:hypothetical protein